MRTIPILALGLALPALVPITAHAQGAAGLQVFARPFQWSDGRTTGLLTITPQRTASTNFGFQPIQVALELNGTKYSGAGVYHSYVDDGINPTSTWAITLIAFSVPDDLGGFFFHQGRIGPGPDYQGSGTYWRPGQADRTIPWEVRARAAPTTTEPVINNTPVFGAGWTHFPFSEAIGRAYYGIGNTQDGATTAAGWGGSLVPGSYDVEVFIPTTFAGDPVQRTRSATYKITAVGYVEVQVSQNVSRSGWVKLGNYSFGDTYFIALVNETGETAGTTRVVANALRLTYVRP